ncbi:sulfatase-like hydrolase/transferase, partial [bacterium]|nr:sulfatase-like hydrolase/transferase [bacterium]
LESTGLRDNTLFWYNSDNGAPREGTYWSPLRAQKGAVYEGGIRVPAVIEWPAVIQEPRVTNVLAVTSDILPTICDLLDLPLPERPLDGASLVPLLEGKMTERPMPIGFESRGQLSLTDNRYKLIRSKAKAPWMLFDIVADPSEKNDIAAQHPDIVKSMEKTVLAWQASCKASLEGKDYR